MSDLSTKPAPNFAPVYAAAMYPELAAIARHHGYALAAHGSLARDLDLIAIPWVDSADAPSDVIESIFREFAVKQVGEAKAMPHGRLAYSLACGWGSCAIDLQFMPRLPMNGEAT